MNIFDQYGIKEVADVTIYSIHKKEDGSGDVYYVPALYLDTLKVTTVEKTAENTWAQGGLGNSRLISWDYGKTINLTLEDALCTPASLGLCWGGILSADWKDAHIQHQTGLQSMDCGMERISRMEKAFYPRNDTVNAVVSNLLPRDATEDILPDQHGDPVYLQRSSILDGVNVKGFGYVDGKPYKWNLEIETAVKSVAMVPDRFYSIYGKSYPIKRRQTVGINQPSELFKYEIIYLRGYDKYDDEPPIAKIIYHAQAEGKPVTDICAATTDDALALKMLDDYDTYPYLKLRMCLDGSVRAYLGTTNVDWDLERQIEDDHAREDDAWIEIPQINTDQFRHMDLWVRFDSINALSYYLITKYESNIFDIGPKEIVDGLEAGRPYTSDYLIMPMSTTGLTEGLEVIESDETFVPNTWYISADFIALAEGVSTFGQSLENYTLDAIRENDDRDKLVIAQSGYSYLIDSEGKLFVKIPYKIADKGTYGQVSDVVGLDYELKDSEAIADAACVPCCKKSNLSRAIWAYVNPRTMTPYDDDYWFHQGEPYYKKSLTLSTKQNPLKAQKIFVEQGVFPGMYKIVGETYIRSRDTGEDQRVQISLPLCKIKSDQTLTLQADGDPTTFNLDVEVATPQNGVPMEITFYEVEKEMKQGCSGTMVPKDGSTKISAK